VNSVRIRLLASALAAASLAALGNALPAQADPITVLSVQSGHSLILNAAGLTRVAVGDGKIAGVAPVGTSQLVINGKSAGHTTVYVWNSGRRATYEVTVTDQGTEEVVGLVRSLINLPTVQVTALNSNILIRGTVPDVVQYNRINDIIASLDKTKKQGGADGKIINVVTVAHPLGNDLQAQIGAMQGASGVRMDPDAKGNVIVSGRVRDRFAAEHLLQRARGLAGPYLATDGKVIDRLEVDTVSQIDVKLYVLEVDKTASSTLGLRLQGAQLGTPGDVSSITYNPGSFIGVEGTRPALVNGGLASTIGGAFFRTTLLAPTLDLLLSQGHAHLLSSPDLMSQQGQQATFLVGGQIPIPYASGPGQVSIQYKEYGVRLDVTPTLLGNGAVDTKVAPEVSSLDFADGVDISGFRVPALRTSKIQTDVVTKQGESIVLGGLVQRVESKTLTKIPGLSALPILGKLFQSTAYQKAESDVVFVMTPTVVTR